MLREKEVVKASPGLIYKICGLAYLFFTILYIRDIRDNPNNLFERSDTRYFWIICIIGFVWLVFAFGSSVTYDKRSGVTTVTRLFFMKSDYQKDEVNAYFADRKDARGNLWDKLVLQRPTGEHIAYIPDNWWGYDEIKHCYINFPPRKKYKKKKKKKTFYKNKR